MFYICGPIPLWTKHRIPAMLQCTPTTTLPTVDQAPYPCNAAVYPYNDTYCGPSTQRRHEAKQQNYKYDTTTRNNKEQRTNGPPHRLQRRPERRPR